MKALKPSSILAVLAASAPLHADAIDDYINQEIARERTPGAALAIIQRGELVRAQGYGYANIEHRVPVHPDTIFQTGSIGKQFTSTAIMLLVEDGKLKLDESIRAYLPEAPQTWQPIKLRHLLTHTSGLPGNPDLDLRRDYTDEELLEVIYGQKLEFQPGERWSYSNAGYALLGLLVKRVSGEFYGDVLKRRVFGPLHMRTARVISDRDIVMNRAAGYEVTDDGIYNQDWVAPTGNSTADGSLYLSVLDYAKWDAGLLAGRLLEPQSWAEVYAPVRLNSGKTYPYGFGWSLEQFAGQEVHQHGGAWQGFLTFFIRYLGEEVSVIVLTNSNHADPERIARGVAGLYDAKLVLPNASPIEDRNPAVTERVKRLLQQLPTQKLDAREFAKSAQQHIDRVAEYYGGRVKAVGGLQELRLFETAERGDDQVYRYRGRFEKGILEIGATVDPDGKFSSLTVKPETAWDSPLQP